VCRAELPSQKEIQGFHCFSQEICAAGDEYKAAQVVEAFVGDRIIALADASEEELACMLAPFGGDAQKYAEHAAATMKLRATVMKNQDDSRKYRLHSQAITYKPTAYVGELQVCPLCVVAC
jgi:hypothetical protein